MKLPKIEMIPAAKAVSRIAYTQQIGHQTRRGENCAQWPQDQNTRIRYRISDPEIPLYLGKTRNADMYIVSVISLYAHAASNQP